MRTLEKVLGANLMIHNWEHLEEVTYLPIHTLVRLFCSLPSVGERLSKKGALFVSWAGESGLHLDNSIRLETCDLQVLFVVLNGAVVEIHTGKKIKFEEDQDGFIHVKRVSEGFSDRFLERRIRAARRRMTYVRLGYVCNPYRKKRLSRLEKAR